SDGFAGSSTPEAGARQGLSSIDAKGGGTEREDSAALRGRGRHVADPGGEVVDDLGGDVPRDLVLLRLAGAGAAHQQVVERRVGPERDIAPADEQPAPAVEVGGGHL